MSKYILKEGSTFGKLTVIGVEESSKIGRDGKRVPVAQWKYWCECSCEKQTIKTIRADHLALGDTVSCGCVWKEAITHGKRKENVVEVCEGYAKLFFYNCDGYTVIDIEDIDKLKPFCWLKSSSGYAVTRTKPLRKGVTMNNFLMNPDVGLVVDHKDNNTLNNRKSNLRIVTQSDNCKNRMVSNSRKYKGVSHRKNHDSWVSSIGKDYVTYYLGNFRYVEEACYAYDIASSILHGEWGKTNQQLGLLNPEDISVVRRKAVETKVKNKLRSKGIDYE